MRAAATGTSSPCRVRPIPSGAARDDYEAFADLAKRLDVWDDFTEGRTVREWVEHIYERFGDQMADRSIDVPAVRRVLGSSARSRCRPTPTITRCSTGSVPTPRRARLGTPSGRIELYSETIDGFGYDDCPGHPVWLEPDEWLGGSRATTFPLAP